MEIVTFAIAVTTSKIFADEICMTLTLTFREDGNMYWNHYVSWP